jgi:hypothetical protein
MASQSSIAEGGSVVTSEEINYQQKLFSHPSYRFEVQYPNTFGQTIALTTSQTPVTINVPPQVFNLSQSYINYTVTLPAAGAGNYTWICQQALAEISHIQFYAGSNMWIVDVDNLQNYLDIVLKKELELQDFLGLDPLNGTSPSNSLCNNIPALRNSNTGSTNVNNGPTNPSAVNYTEPAYFAVSGPNTAVVYDVQIPLRFIKNTAFSIDKNLYFGQTTYFKVYFGSISKVCYVSTSNNNPSAGTKTAYTGAATISAFNLMLAVETNQDLRTMTINKVASSGQSYMIPYVQAFKNSNSGTSQNISIQLDQGNGKTLMKVYHAPYNNQEQFDTMYDHSNNDTVAGVFNSGVNQKVLQYYTQLNGQRIQNITIDCTSTGPYLDYMSMRRQLRGSIIQNLNVFQYNWFHCDDWCNFGSKYDQENKGELLSGIPLTVAPLTWSFVGVSLRAAGGVTANSFQWYTWFVFLKKLSMSPGTVTVE